MQKSNIDIHASRIIKPLLKRSVNFFAIFQENLIT